MIAMGDAFWKRVALGGTVAAAVFIYWPAIAAAWRGDWLHAGVAFAGTSILLFAIYWQTRKRTSR